MPRTSTGAPRDKPANGGIEIGDDLDLALIAGSLRGIEEGIKREDGVIGAGWTVFGFEGGRSKVTPPAKSAAMD